jgi:molybdenum cofactor cytidylyltransferase
MTTKPRTFALIPAAGLCRRMGRPKLELPLGERTVLQRVLDAVRRAGVGPVLVVLGPHVADLQPQATAAGAEVLLLPEETPDMRATVERGLAWIEQAWRPDPEDRWLLLPADHPTLDGQVVAELLHAQAGRPERGVAIPTYQGKRGHPALVAWRHVADLRALPAGVGLNAFFRGGVDVLEVPLNDAAVLTDLDTPEEYERLCQRWAPG